MNLSLNKSRAVLLDTLQSAGHLKKMPGKSALLGVTLFLIAGCGYSFYVGVAGGFRTIYIENLENKTYEHGLEILAAEAIRNEFIFDGNLKVVKREEADLLLSGSVIEYVFEPLTYDEDDEAEGYWLKIRTKLTLKNLNEDKPVWTDKTIEGDARYFVSGSLAGTKSGAWDEALKDLAKEVVRQTIEIW